MDDEKEREATFARFGMRTYRPVSFGSGIKHNTKYQVVGVRQTDGYTKPKTQRFQRVWNLILLRVDLCQMPDDKHLQETLCEPLVV